MNWLNLAPLEPSGFVVFRRDLSEELKSAKSYDPKFQNVKNSAFILRRINDELCRAHGLSVIENPKKKAKSQKETATAQYGVSHKKQLQQTIDRVLTECNNYEEFLAKMRAEGYEVVDGKNPGFRLPVSASDKM